MRRTFSSILVLLLLCGLMLAPAMTAQAGSNLSAWHVQNVSGDKLSPRLREQLSSLQSDQTITVIVQLRQKANLPPGRGLGRAEQLSRVIKALSFTAERTQGPVKKFLENRKTSGQVEQFTAFWILNGFSVTATPDAILELSLQPDVLSVTTDELDIIPVSAPNYLSNPEANITLVNAPSLWGKGYTGQGVVVASMDSGVDLSHSDLSSRWRGGSNSWYDPYGQHPTTPTDKSGHGTWTMGVMVGGDAGGTSIGVAPDAQWIAVKMFNDAGGTTATAVHLGYQWLLDPDGSPATNDAPDVVNNSWSFSAPGCNLDFEPDLQVLRAAGILPVFAAGNGGPNANTSYSPANNPSAFAVGAINNSSSIYGLSSRGPTTCGGSTGVFPEVVAPGVNINTTDLGGFYTTASGTSLAAPHVAGGLALLISAFPNLSVTEQQNALINSAVDRGVTGPDDIYGYGRIDLLAAFNWLSSPVPSTPTYTSVVSTATYTPSNTPVPPIATLTSTNTSTVTSTFTFTPTATATNTFTDTPVPPTSTFTKTAIPTSTFTLTSTNTATATNTFTNTPVSPTSTFTKTATPPNTITFTPTKTATATNTFTNTPIPPTSTFTKTATPANTLIFTPTKTALPTNTFTNTPVQPTNTPLPPANTFTATATYTFTNTAIPPTYTRTPSKTPVSPTALFTSTTVVTATKTSTPQPANTPTSTQSSSMQSKVVAPASLTSQSGLTSGFPSSLSLLQQTGTDDNPDAYVAFQTPGMIYAGYQSFYLPADVEPALISTMLLQVNIKGPASSTQKWTFSIYDWNKRMWIKLGDTVGTNADQWNDLTFRINNISRYMSPAREIRIRLQSSNSNGDAKVDYEALHITYHPVAVTLPATAPTAPARRPGIASDASHPPR